MLGGGFSYPRGGGGRGGGGNTGEGGKKKGGGVKNFEKIANFLCERLLNIRHVNLSWVSTNMSCAASL